MWRRVPRIIVVVVFTLLVIGGTIFAIQFAKGYRPSLQTGSLQGTGLLAANSTPRGASVLINDKLTTATDDTLNLPPGEYKIKIQQDGYIPWEKTLTIEAELVTQTNTRLFPSVPDLKPLTFSGAVSPTPSPNGEKMAYSVEHATTDTKNGLYVMDLADRAFPINSAPRQIARNSGNFNFAVAQLTWSADNTQILATFNPDLPTEANILLDANRFNDVGDWRDVTATLPVQLNEWNNILDQNEHDFMIQLPPTMAQIATASATAIYFSPDGEKMLYTATASAQIPAGLIPTLPASSTQDEQRTLQPGNIYVYDLKEDKNFWIAAALEPSKEKLSILQVFTNRSLPLNVQPTQWYPDSRHLIMVESEPARLVIAEYDGTNRQTVYAGPFAQNFAFPWPDGSRLLILASLNGGGNLPPNLYSINLK
ncbi:MAG TPA: PEGA domain-containing protein [Patescibacteria group bacterium]|nr:PEGA domain-containing protein [Patescibacteria group bacterium]